MRLFRESKTKSSHPHAKALEHLQTAHTALKQENARTAMQHIGHALKAIQTVNQASQQNRQAPPNQAPPKPPTQAPGGLQGAASRLQGFNRMGGPTDGDQDDE